VKKTLLKVAFAVAAAALSAGDVATFANLGFSADAAHFMYGQFGATSSGAQQFAEIAVVDVAKNDFVPQGRKAATFAEPLSFGATGLGALLNHLRTFDAAIDRYRIDHLKVGRLLYILVDGDEPKAELDFRDFETDRRYRITLAQSRFGADREVASSFHLLVRVIEAGSDRTLTVGLPDLRRPGVQDYRIKQVILAPDARSLVFVIERREVTDDGVSIRYMVETVDP
jgi:predicted secreted protein